jgi:hypothetical protein
MAKDGDVFVAVSLVPGVSNQKVIFRHVQPGFEELPSISMYDLTEDISGHPKDSTVSRNTLEESGYVLPQEAP